MTKNPFAVAILVLLFTSCGNTKYNYHFERGRMVDFTEGEWILNRPVTNYDEERINKIAIRELRKILGDSLVSFQQLRSKGVLPAWLAFDLSKDELAGLKTATGKDFLINVQSNMLKNEMGSFAHAPAVGSTLKTNEAGIKIRIYDLNTRELISESSATGTAKIAKTADDNSWDYVNSAETISMQGLIKLIKRYRKYGITN